MLDENTLRDSLRHHCREVFETMFGVEVTEMARQNGPVLDHVERVVSLIGFAGNYTGNCIITCSTGLACKLASNMLMEEFTELSDTVMDAYGELSNMIFGNVKTELEEILGPLQLSLPSVIVGREFSLKSLASPLWITLPLRVGGEELEARMCVSQSPGRATGARREQGAALQA